MVTASKVHNTRSFQGARMYVATKSNECKTVLGYTPNAYYRCTQMHARTHLSNGKGDILCRLLCMTTDVHKCMCYIVPHDKSANAPLKSNALELAPWSPLRWKNTDPNTVVTAGKVRYRTAFQGAHMYTKYKWHSTALRACIHEYINARILTILLISVSVSASLAVTAPKREYIEPAD